MALLAYAVWLVVALLFQRYIMYPGVFFSGTEPARTVHVLERTIDDGGVPAYLRPADRPGESDVLIVFLHGNAETAAELTHEPIGYSELGVDVLFMEYRGYARAAGDPSEEALTDDVRYFTSKARKRYGYDHVVFHGRSLGGGVAASALHHYKPDALILQSTFTSAASFSYRYLLPSFIVRDPYRVKQAIADYRTPLLLFHGRHDTIVPYDHAQSLQLVRPESELVTMDCAHNDCPGDFESYRTALYEFLNGQGLSVQKPTADGEIGR